MDALGNELNRLLVDTYRAAGKIEQVMLADLSDGKLSLSEMRAIECVGSGRLNGRTITEISQELGITLPSVTAVIKRLEQKGYVAKEKGRSDGRMVHITLTPEGRRADIAHRYFHRRMVNAVRQSVDESEQDVLLRAMEAINEFIRLKLRELEAGAKGE